MSDFGEMVATSRRKRVMTQAALADRVSDHLGEMVSQPWVSQVETGKVSPDHWQVLALCLVLHINAIEAFDALGWIGDTPEWGKRVEEKVDRLLYAAVLR